MRRTFAHPVDRVYHVWTDPAYAARWSWGRRYDTVAVAIDCRAGGIWRQQICDRTTQENWFFDGVFEVVIPRLRLAHSFHWRSDRGADHGKSRVVVEFIALGESTEVIITHTLLPKSEGAGTASGWGEVYDAIDGALKQ